MEEWRIMLMQDAGEDIIDDEDKASGALEHSHRFKHRA